MLSSPALGQPAPEELRLELPVSPACVSSGFGERHGAGPRASRLHQGIDLPAPAGAWVRAVADGQVAAIRRRGSAGLEVELRHAAETGGVVVTRYAHLGSIAPALARGRRVVTRGAPLGRIGRSGITYGTHLHFELLWRGTRLDPAPYLRVAPCPTP
jgi:murein DD-endopeptidase MepM/ murein hydrolase activator NlpD